MCGNKSAIEKSIYLTTTKISFLKKISFTDVDEIRMLNVKNTECLFTLRLALTRHTNVCYYPDFGPVTAKDEGEAWAKFEERFIEILGAVSECWDSPYARNPEFFLGDSGNQM